jgi:hypothetical protein
MTLLSLLEIALLAYVPGALLFRAPILDPTRRRTLPIEERVFWGVVLSVSLSCMVTLALASVGWYRYGRLLGLNTALSVTALLVWRRALWSRSPAAPPRRRPTIGEIGAALAPVALVALGLWLYSPPAEYVMGGKDPGAYMNTGIQIAQRGALETRDPVVASVPPPLRDLFFPSHQQPTYYSVRFMGFFIMDPDTGRVLDQFPHFFPASIAIGYGVNGLTGARQVTLAWALLGLVAVYLTGARLFGRAAAAAGAVLLLVNVIEVWFARYPNAEVVAQALLFAAMLAWSRAQADDQPFFGPVAASLIGMLLFLRFDMVLALVGFVGAAALGRAAGQRPVVGFFATLTLWSAFAALYLFGMMKPYMALPLAFAANLDWWQAALLVVAGLVALALLAGASRLTIMQRLVPLVPPALIALVLALAIYAWFFRAATGRTAIHDAMALRTFALYVTPFALVAALLGYVAAVRRRLTQDPVFFLTLTTFACFVFYKIRIVPEHYWMARRFLPVILPGALLLVGYAALGRWAREERTEDWEAQERRNAEAQQRLIEDGPRRQGVLTAMRMAAGVVLVSLLAVTFWRQSQPLFGYVEYAGLIPRLEALAAKLADDDLVIVESRDASDVHVLALPLAYIYARNVILLANRRPDPVQFKAFLDWAHTRYKRIFFMGGGGTDLLSRDVSVRPIGTEVFQVPEWETSRTGLPTGARRKEFDFSIYEMTTRAGDARTAPTPSTTTAGVVTLDVGVNDDLNVLRFHAKERHGNGTTFRWSRDVSYINLMGIPASARTLTLVMDDGRRPPSAPKAEMRVDLDDHPLGTLTVGPDFRSYTLAIPPEVAAEAASRGLPARLKLVTTTWRPKAVIGVPDDRDLGVMVDRVEVR